MLRRQLFQHAPTKETCIRKIDTGLLKEKEKGRESRQSIFSPLHPKRTPRKVDTVQMVLDRDVVYDEHLIHDPVSQSQEPAPEVFITTAVAALPR